MLLCLEKTFLGRGCIQRPVVLAEVQVLLIQVLYVLFVPVQVQVLATVTLLLLLVATVLATVAIL